MASIKHNSIVAASSGKMGGNIFSRNKSGVSVRCARSSTNVQTSKSVSRRNFLRQLGVLWRTAVNYVFPVQYISNPEFYSDLPPWIPVRCTASYRSPSVEFTTLPGEDNSLLSYYDSSIPAGDVYLVFGFNPALSSNLVYFKVFLYSINPVVSLYTQTFYPGDPYALVGVHCVNPSPGMFIYLYQSGIDSTSVFDFCFLYSSKNVFNISWSLAAKNFPYSDRLGDTRTLTGQQLFIKLSLNLKELGLDPVLNAPVPSLLEPLVLLPGSGTSDSLVINSNQFPLHSDCAVLIFATRTFPKSVTTWKPQEMKQIRPTPEITINSINVFSQYVSIYGASSLIVGGHVFIKVSYFDKRTGQKINSVTQSINIV